MASLQGVEKYDNALLGILQSEGQIGPFLDVIFGFLYRRTDYYRILRNENDKMGFREGVAEAFALRAFKKYQRYATEDENKRLLNADVTNEVPPVGKIEEVVTSDEPTVECSSEKKSSIIKDEYISYNGAVQDKYCWSQSLVDLDVHVKVSKQVTKANMVKVNIDHQHIKVEAKMELGEFETLVDGQLSWKINVEESMWTLIPGEHIHMNLCKIDERWWDALLENETKIDLQKIESVKSMDDLPDDEHAKLEELIFNEQQKALNKPTTNQMKIHDILKKAWDAEGSPFMGQPFDLSTVNVLDSSGMSNLNIQS